ncbi:MAG: hypothetical protein JO199_11765, partial [Candidatus Eremiobacteraeota bacterium]|nr:hypothetical protein [Candidatus Eremiobacteraeota bacterium]
NWTLNTILPGAGTYGIAIDSHGNAWLGEHGSQVTEVLAVGGTIPSNPSTVTFNGFTAATGIAVDSSNNVYVNNYCACGGWISELKAVSGTVPANQTPITLGSGLGLSDGVAVDSHGNVFAADISGNRIAELVAIAGAVPPNSSFVTVGSGFSSPYGVAVDAANNVYVAQPGNQAIQEILAVGGVLPNNPTILTLGGGLTSPWAAAVSNNGTIYVADYTGGVKEMPAGCSSAACVTQISGVVYATAIAVGPISTNARPRPARLRPRPRVGHRSP